MKVSANHENKMIAGQPIEYIRQWQPGGMGFKPIKRKDEMLDNYMAIAKPEHYRETILIWPEEVET